MGVNATGVTSAVVTVTTAGTRVQLSANPIAVNWVWISSPTSGNTNNIYVGGSNVSSTNGLPLAAGGGANGRIMLPNSNSGQSVDELRLDLIYLDADTNGNTARIVYDVKVST